MEKKSGFYGGKIGIWLPILFMLAGMLVSTIIGGGLARLTGITFFALALGFLLAKDKKNYGKITLKGLQNPMLGTSIMAYIMAGMTRSSSATAGTTGIPASSWNPAVSAGILSCGPSGGSRNE